MAAARFRLLKGFVGLCFSRRLGFAYSTSWFPGSQCFAYCIATGRVMERRQGPPWGLSTEYYRDPLPHSPLGTSKLGMK